MTTKSQRQHHVARLLTEHEVTSQPQLVELLAAAGIVATQATVSRDLEDLGAVKVRLPGGELAYAIPEYEPDRLAPHDHLRRVLGEWVAEVAHSGNLVVVRTPPGCAHVVASALDRSGLPGLARHRRRRRHDAVRGVRARRRRPPGQDAARPRQPVHPRGGRPMTGGRVLMELPVGRAGRAGVLRRARHVRGGGVDAGEGRRPVHLHRRPRPGRRARPAPACPTGPAPTAPRRPAWSTAATSSCTRAWSRCSAAPSTSPPPARRTSTRRRSGGR